MTTLSRERVEVNANSCCLSLLDNRVLGVSNFSLPLSLSFTNHSLFLSHSLSSSLYVLPYSHHLCVLPYLSLRVPTTTTSDPSCFFIHTLIYILYLYIYISGNMTVNFSKHAPFNGPHDTITLWSGAPYESLTFSSAFRRAHIIITPCLRREFKLFPLLSVICSFAGTPTRYSPTAARANRYTPRAWCNVNSISRWVFVLGMQQMRVESFDITSIPSSLFNFSTNLCNVKHAAVVV